MYPYSIPQRTPWEGSLFEGFRILKEFLTTPSGECELLEASGSSGTGAVNVRIRLWGIPSVLKVE